MTEETIKTWSEWWPTARNAFVKIEALLLVYAIGIYVSILYMPQLGEYETTLWGFLVILQFYAVVRIVGWKYGVTGEDLQP